MKSNLFLSKLDNANRDAINKRLSFPLFSDIKKYEKIYNPRVIQIANKIERDKVLKNPIVWDSEKRLLIDGHHRIAALSLLGFSRVPAYHTDYLGKSVKVFPWYRIVYQVSVKRVLDIFNLIKISNKNDYEKSKKWQIFLKTTENRTIASKSFSTSFEAAYFIDWFYQFCKEDGFRIELSAQVPAKKWENSDTVFLSMSTLIGKNEVLKASDNGMLFPSQVNRHVIEGRLINIMCPLNNLNDTKNESELKYFLNNSEYVYNNKGIWFDGRFYQEATIQILSK